MHALLLACLVLRADAFREKAKPQQDAQLEIDKAKAALKTGEEKAEFEKELKEISLNAQAVNAARFDSQLKEAEAAFSAKYGLEPWLESLTEPERSTALREAAKHRFAHSEPSQDAAKLYSIASLGVGAILLFGSVGYGIHAGPGMAVYATGSIGLLCTVVGAFLYVSGV